MVKLKELESYLNQLLNIQAIKDYCPNGLQVAGKSQIKKIVTGVTACQELLDAAVAEQADAILVHHGYFWKNEDPCLIGVKYNRVRTLLQNGISLWVYHLPLDLHPVYGNNVQLGLVLDLSVSRRFTLGGIPELGCIGELTQAMTTDDFQVYLTEKLARKPSVIKTREKPIQTLAWCTGAAQGFIEEVANQGVDAYLSGEISLQTVPLARELGIDFFSAGHHATERYGVMALGRHLAQEFGIEHQFIDIDNPF